MAIDFTKYEDVDFEVPANMCACFCCEIPRYINKSSLFDAYYNMGNGYLDTADEICKHIYSAFKHHRKADTTFMIGPMIRLYYQSVELYTKAMAIKSGIDKPHGHNNKEIFDSTLKHLSSGLYDYNLADKCRNFLKICDNYNEGSQFGRYPVDKQNNVMGITYNESGNKDGYYVIGIMKFAYFIHQGVKDLKKLYDNIAVGSEEANE